MIFHKFWFFSQPSFINTTATMRFALVFTSSVLTVTNAVTSVSRYYLKSDCSGEPVYISINNNNPWENLKNETCIKEGHRYVSQSVSNVSIDRPGAPAVSQGISLYYFSGDDCKGIPTRMESFTTRFAVGNQSFQLLKCSDKEAKAMWVDGLSTSQQMWDGGCNKLEGQAEKSLLYQCRNLIKFSNSAHHTDMALLNLISSLFGGLLLWLI